MDLTELISSYSIFITAVGSALVLFLVFLSLVIKKLSPFLKKVLFISMASIIVLVTLFLAGSTIYLNSVSVSKGPVHIHADFEIWACGKEIDLKDPVGLSNKIGTPTLHEHNDKRIHLEGVIVKDSDASLGKFFNVIGGKLTKDSLVVPTNNGQVRYSTGDLCPDGQMGTLQVFLYKTDGDTYSQERLSDPASYTITREQNVPPGDCIIVNFGPFENRTDKLCRSYKVANQTGRLKGEIENGN